MSIDFPIWPVLKERKRKKLYTYITKICCKCFNKLVVVGISLYRYNIKVMTINELVARCKDIVLNKLEFASFNIGNTWDQATQKGDTYPTAWIELPILVDYSLQDKQYGFSIVFLTMPKLDDVADEMNKISDIERYSDLFLQNLRKDNRLSIVNNPTGISVKTINADYACGIRLDIRINTGRECSTICPPNTIC